MSRLTAVVRTCLTTLLLLACAGITLGQEPPREFTLPGGAIGVHLDPTSGHTIVAYPADGGVALLCLQGDEHTGLEAMRWIQRESAEAGIEPPASLRPAAGALSATLRYQPAVRAGADDERRMLLYTPDALQPGSSRSHFDTRARPNLLMEPAINADLPIGGIDLTDKALRDLGWRGGSRLTTEILYSDPEGYGFNDPKLGPERRAALEAATAIWGQSLRSPIPVVIEAVFLELFCDPAVGAALAGAGPTFAFADFDSGVPDTWYPVATAESLSGVHLNEAGTADILIVFNAAIDDRCLGRGTGWFYGTEGSAPAGRIPFLTVALHEMAHGLGFTGFSDLQSGALLLGRPDIYTRLMHDNKRDATWDELGKAGRRRSAVRDGEVVLDGRRTRRGASALLDGDVTLKITGASDLAGVYRVGTASFGPQIGAIGPLGGELALVDDGTATPRLACSPLINPSDIAGRIAVVVRGACAFTDKVLHAQEAGAIGVIVVDNFPGSPSGMGGFDPAVTIPAVMIERQLGSEIRTVLR